MGQGYLCKTDFCGKPAEHKLMFRIPVGMHKDDRSRTNAGFISFFKLFFSTLKLQGHNLFPVCAVPARNLDNPFVKLVRKLDFL